MPFYAVAKGRNTGISTTWDDCREQVSGYSGAVYQKFETAAEANRFVQERGSSTVENRNYSPSTYSCYQGSSGASPSVQRGQGNFTVDKDGYPNVYTDGACGSNGQQGAKAGYGVYFGENHPMNASEPVRGRATNNTGEIQAATRAMELAKQAGLDKIKINTDSQFMIDGATNWMNNWKANDWKKSDGGDVVNRSDWEALNRASQGLDVKYEHIPAHKGIPGNEAADRLAREGAKRYQ